MTIVMSKMMIPKLPINELKRLNIGMMAKRLTHPKIPQPSGIKSLSLSFSSFGTPLSYDESVLYLLGPKKNLNLRSSFPLGL